MLKKLNITLTLQYKNITLFVISYVKFYDSKFLKWKFQKYNFYIAN